MKSFCRYMVFMFSLICGIALSANAQENGEALFKTDCTACHTIGRGKLVGPDLANVGERRPEDWLISFIKSSQTVIQSGDTYADSLFKAFNQMPMPDHKNLSNGQIKSILAYIQTQSSSSQTAAATELPAGDAARGKALFVGDVRFANRGASCNSCHNVDLKGYLSGGALGNDLTHAVGRLSSSGVAAIISGLPFPQMKETYASKPVTPQEVADLTVFLAKVDKEAPEEVTAKAGNYLLTGGISGIAVLLGLYSFFWIRRKRGPVNKIIFNRQLKSA